MQQPKNVNLSLLNPLMAFSFFGYAYLFGTFLGLHPDIKNIGDSIFNLKHNASHLLFKENYSDDLLGLNLINGPRDYKALLAVFDLISDGNYHRYGVILPGPQKVSAAVIPLIKKELSEKKKINFSLVNFKEPLPVEDKETVMTFYKTFFAKKPTS